jgi:hypothetical protein
MHGLSDNVKAQVASTIPSKLRNTEEAELSSIDVLRNSSFGKRTAEEEREHLRAYFVETEQWRQVFKGEVDVVYVRKEAAKVRSTA